MSNGRAEARPSKKIPLERVKKVSTKNFLKIIFIPPIKGEETKPQTKCKTTDITLPRLLWERQGVGGKHRKQSKKKQTASESWQSAV